MTRDYVSEARTIVAEIHGATEQGKTTALEQEIAAFLWKMADLVDEARRERGAVLGALCHVSDEKDPVKAAESAVAQIVDIAHDLHAAVRERDELRARLAAVTAPVLASPLTRED